MRIVMLAGDGQSSDIVYNYLSQHFSIEKVIIESNEPRCLFLKRRVNKLGLIKVLGQISFRFLALPLLSRQSKKRREELMLLNRMSCSQQYRMTEVCQYVDSVNGEDCRNLLKSIQPDVVVVNGTRIISKKVLQLTDAVFINMHAGITPAYRGVHGTYWALYNKDEQNAGVSIHLVDEGIDTGSILYQDRIKPSKQDNFCSYPILQLAAGIPLMIHALEDVKAGTLQIHSVNLPSKLYYHPTLLEYAKGRIISKVK